MERERVAIRRKHAAREARRAAELPGIEARSAAILASIHAPKDGMSVPGACARCGTETELRVWGTTMVLCRPCWMAW
ncbi:MAG: hypothetical protein IT379_29115 [Deltaproteobacteria bacterium]|nr:hypothetical protein [Deltaproteobacteria bacterium]